MLDEAGDDIEQSVKIAETSSQLKKDEFPKTQELQQNLEKNDKPVSDLRESNTQPDTEHCADAPHKNPGCLSSFADNKFDEEESF